LRLGAGVARILIDPAQWSTSASALFCRHIFGKGVTLGGRRSGAFGWFGGRGGVANTVPRLPVMLQLMVG